MKRHNAERFVPLVVAALCVATGDYPLVATPTTNPALTLTSAQGSVSELRFSGNFSCGQ